MRHENQHWNALRATLEMVGSGGPLTGLSPTVEIQRISDGQYWNGAAWVGAPSAQAMTEHASFGGWYEYVVDPSGLTYNASLPGYRMRIVETTTPTREFVLVSTIRREAFKDVEPFSGATYEAQFFRMMSLRQENVRVIYDTWTAGGQPQHGFVYVYENAADCAADVTPFPLAVGVYEINTAYDGQSRPTEYTSVRNS